MDTFLNDLYETYAVGVNNESSIIDGVQLVDGVVLTPRRFCCDHR